MVCEMQGVFNIPERWSDPVVGLRRVVIITLAILVVESLPILVKGRRLSVAPIVLLGLIRLADIVILWLGGPQWLKGPDFAKRLKDAAVVTLLFAGGGILFLMSWRTVFGVSMLGNGGGTAYQHPSSFAGFLITAGLLSPVAEEFYFRGLLYRGLRQKGSLWFSLTIVSLLFAGVHLWLSNEVLFPLLGGIVFCVGYEMTKTILTPILLHISGNLIIYMSPFIRWI